MKLRALLFLFLLAPFASFAQVPANGSGIGSIEIQQDGTRVGIQYAPFRLNFSGCTVTKSGIAYSISCAASVAVNGSTVASPNFNGSTPAAGANGKNLTFQASGSSISGEIVGDGNAAHFLDGTGNYSAASGGITSITQPSAVFAGTPCSGPTCTFTLNNQQAGYVWQGPPSTFQNGFLVQSLVCALPSGQSVTCVFPSAVNAGDELIVWQCNPGGFNGGVPTDGQSDTFTIRASTNGSCQAYTAKNVVGGATTITAHEPSAFSGGQIAILEFSGVNISTDFDAAATELVYTASANPLAFNAVTTANAHDIIIGLVGSTAGSASNAFSSGGSYAMAANSLSSQYPVGISYTNVSTTGSYAPLMFTQPSFFGSNQTWLDVIALKAATTPASQTPIFAPISTTTLTAGGINPPLIIYTNTVTGKTAAIADSAMVTAPTSALYTFSGMVNCTTTSAAATATLNLKYTDTGSTAQTVSVTDTCTALTTSGVPNLNVALRAKTGTAITWGVTIANTPTYDVDVRLLSY